MSDPMRTDDEYVMRNEETTAALDVRRLERSAEAQGDALARRLDKLDDAQRRSAREIEEEYRREHFGRSWVPWPPPADAASKQKQPE
jgi:hypothetical protein